MRALVPERSTSADVSPPHPDPRSPQRLNTLTGPVNLWIDQDDELALHRLADDGNPHHDDREAPEPRHFAAQQAEA